MSTVSGGPSLLTGRRALEHYRHAAVNNGLQARYISAARQHYHLLLLQKTSTTVLATPSPLVETVGHPARSHIPSARLTLAWSLSIRQTLELLSRVRQSSPRRIQGMS